MTFPVQRTAAASLVPRLAWSDARTRAVAWQAAALVVVAAVVALVVFQTSANLRERHIASGFDYLGRAAGFEISRGPLSYSSSDSYARALALGLFNTLRVSLLGIAIATALGVGLGVGRLSTIWVVRAVASAYVEVMRNTPLLLQLLFWYSLWQALPHVRDAVSPLPGVYLSDRGLFLPGLVWDDGSRWFVVDRPALVGFDFRGGLSLSPEFAALLIGLSTCTAAFIGEIVRGGILAVDRGQTEAAAALGLSRARILRLVVLPQALPAIVPPTTSQFLNLAKNSSLAVAIGYPDLISVTNTTINQTGQAIEAIAVAASVYLTISLAIAVPMGLYDRAVARRGRDGGRA